MVAEPCDCILFLLCVICQVPFHDALDCSNEISSISEQKNSSNENEELYKRFVVFEKGKDNPYWNVNYIYELVKNILKRFTVEHSSMWESDKQTKRELQNRVNSLECLLNSHYDSQATDMYKYFIACKQIIFL